MVVPSPVVHSTPTENARPGREVARKAVSLSLLLPFLEIAIPFFREDRNAFCSLVGIVTLTLIQSALNIAFSYVRRDMFNALNDREQAIFYVKIVEFFGVLAVIVPIAVTYNYLRLKLALYWRKELTARVLDLYYANRTFYVIECCKDIDNPDQRICEDLTEFTSTSLDFFFIVLDAVINLLSFSAVLFEIYPLLFVAIILYALMGTTVSLLLGRSLVGQYYDKLQTEADFRFGLIRTRENAEGIAFYDSEATMEQVNLWVLFEKAINTQLGIIRTQRRLEMFTTSYDYLVYVIPYLVVAPLYFQNKLDLGSITQSSEAFYYVRSDFSIIVNYFEKLSAFSAGIKRLSTFIHRINQGGWQSDQGLDISKASEGELSPLHALGRTLTNTGAPDGYSRIDGKDTEVRTMRSTILLVTGPMPQTTLGLVKDDDVKHTVLHCENLSILTPDGSRTLLGGALRASRLGLGLSAIENEILLGHGVNFKINRGDRVLVVGPSGTGKSSLLRAISGLWELGSGTVTWSIGSNSDVSSVSGRSSDSISNNQDRVSEAPEGVFFLPQKPYNLLGSLRQQIAYPDIYRGQLSTNEFSEVSSHRLRRQRFKIPRNDGLLSPAHLAQDDDKEFLEILRRVKLETLAARMGAGDEVQGLGSYRDWSKVLSLGEQQRLAFARVLYNRKNIAVAVLDEATSALDDASEAAMYSLLGDLNITYISVGHRASLYAYHTKKLGLNGPGCEVDYESIRRIEA